MNFFPENMSRDWNEEQILNTDRKNNRSNRAGIKKNIVVAAALIMSCFFIFSCVNDPKQIEELTKQKKMVDEAKNVVSYLSQQGQLKAKLTAPVMNRYETDSVYFIFPNTLHVDFYDDSANRESWLDSKHGKYFQTLNKVYLWDSVVVINVKGDTLRSPDLWWDQNAKLFYTDKPAEYHTRSQKIAGSKGAEATQDLTHITFKQTTGILLVTDNGLAADSSH